MSKDNKPETEAAKAKPPVTATPETFEEKHAEVIREKVRAGLTRSQAIEVIKAQLAHDQALAAAAKPAAK